MSSKHRGLNKFPIFRIQVRQHEVVPEWQQTIEADAKRGTDEIWQLAACLIEAIKNLALADVDVALAADPAAVDAYALRADIHVKRGE